MKKTVRFVVYNSNNDEYFVFDKEFNADTVRVEAIKELETLEFEGRTATAAIIISENCLQAICR